MIAYMCSNLLQIPCNPFWPQRRYPHEGKPSRAGDVASCACPRKSKACCRVTVSCAGGVKSSFLGCTGYGEASAEPEEACAWDPACVVCADMLTSHETGRQWATRSGGEGTGRSQARDALDRDDTVGAQEMVRAEYVMIVTACNEVLLVEARGEERDGAEVRRKTWLLAQGHAREDAAPGWGSRDGGIRQEESRGGTSRKRVDQMEHAQQSRGGLASFPGPADPAETYEWRMPSVHGMPNDEDKGADARNAPVHDDHVRDARVVDVPAFNAVAAHPSMPNLFATGGVDGTVRVWDCCSGAMVAMARMDSDAEHGGAPSALAQKQRRNGAADAAEKSASSGACPSGAYPSGAYPVAAVAWSGREGVEHHVAVGLRNGQIRIVAFTQGRRLLRVLQTLCPPAPPPRHPPLDQKTLMPTRTDQHSAGDPPHSSRPHPIQPRGATRFGQVDAVVCLQYRRDGSLLAAGTSTGRVYVWSLAGSKEYVLAAHARCQAPRPRSDLTDTVPAVSGVSSGPADDRIAEMGARGGSNILSLDWAAYARSGLDARFLRAATCSNHVEVWLVREAPDAGPAGGGPVVLEGVAGSAWTQKLGDVIWETWTCTVGWTVDGLHAPQAAAGGAKLLSRNALAERAAGAGLGAGPVAAGKGKTGPGRRSSGVMMVDCYGEGRRDTMWVRDLAVAADSDGRIRLARSPVLRGAQAWQARLLPEMKGPAAGVPAGCQAGICGAQGPGCHAGMRFSCDGKRVLAVAGECVRVFAVVPSGEARHEDPAVRAERRAAMLASEAEREVRALQNGGGPGGALGHPCCSSEWGMC
jgi:hypothetical protein